MLEEESVDKFLSRRECTFLKSWGAYKRKIEKTGGVCARVYVYIPTNLTIGKTAVPKCQYSLYEFMHL